MKFTLAVLASTLAVSTATMSAAPAFEEFKLKHGKSYDSPEEHAKRFEIFVNNVEEFKQLNAELKAKGKDEIHGVTKFSDMTREEFTSMYLGAKFTKDSFPKVTRVAKTEDFIQTANTTVTGAYSLWDDNFATPVKDQAQCGSCWAFATTETVESTVAVAGKGLEVLSPQAVVSCDVNNGDYGCNGGMPSTAMGWVIKNGGLPTEDGYPYTSGGGDTGVCDDSKNTVAGGTISDWAYTQPTCQPGSAACVEDSEAMANGVKSGGIAIAIDASGFFSYTGGVMTNDSCSSDPSSLDHAIQVVGWDTTDSANPYWIVRNSWATVWGEEGLVKFAMGDNTCGIANFAVVAIV